MKASLRWLRELTGLAEDVDVDTLASRLHSLGLLVEKVHLPPSLDEVVVAEVRERRPIEGARKVQLVVVDDGTTSDREVMCGAFNFDVGDRVPLARPGAVLPDGMQIAVREVRSLGVTSHGMLCSAAELGLSDDHSGILVLDADAALGAPVVEALGRADVVFELEITPNRPDCMGMVGVAREVAAAYDTELLLPPEPVGPSAAAPATRDAVTANVLDPEGCTRFTATVVDGVTVGPSPRWMQDRLRAAGMRPVNNVVDCTNYVMLEWGQPAHAFDLDRLAGAAVVVRGATDGETLTTLDDVERTLAADDVVVCDADGPVALAGIMGGATSEVTDATTRVLLEVAHFEPSRIMRTSKRCGLRSEASARFERGTDPGGCATVAARCAALIAETSGGVVRSDPLDVVARPVERRVVPLRAARVNAVLGTGLDADEVAALLTPIGMRAVGVDDDDAVLWEVPSWRPDVEREIDLIEEVARCHGYDAIGRSLPSGAGRIGGLSPLQKAERRLRAALSAAGVHDAQTNSVVTQATLDRLRWGTPPSVTIRNPLRDEDRTLRMSLLPNICNAASYNVARGVASVRLGEVGTVFAPSGALLPDERRMCCVVLAGAERDSRVHDAGGSAGRPYDVYDVKGVLESVADDLGVTFEVFGEVVGDDAVVPAGLHPGRSAAFRLVGDDAPDGPIGWFGELHPRVADAFDLPRSTVAAEFDTAPVLAAHVALREWYDPVSPFPATTRDMAFVVDDAVVTADLLATVRRAAGDLCRGVELFDVYRGAGVADGSRSVAVEVVFRAPDRTLTDDEVGTAVDAMVRAAQHAHGAELRG